MTANAGAAMHFHPLLVSFDANGGRPAAIVAATTAALPRVRSSFDGSTSPLSGEPPGRSGGLASTGVAGIWREDGAQNDAEITGRKQGRI